MASILLIEDDKFVRFTLKRILTGAGHEVLEAESGVEGTEYAKTTSIELVITDLLMPDKDGINVILELKKANSEMKIIAVSGGGQEGRFDLLPVAERLGANATLQKPIEEEDLLAAINRLL